MRFTTNARGNQLQAEMKALDAEIQRNTIDLTEFAKTCPEDELEGVGFDDLSSLIDDPELVARLKAATTRFSQEVIDALKTGE